MSLCKKFFFLQVKSEEVGNSNLPRIVASPESSIYTVFHGHFTRLAASNVVVGGHLQMREHCSTNTDIDTEIRFFQAATPAHP